MKRLWKAGLTTGLLTIAATAQAQTSPDVGLNRAEARLERIERPERPAMRAAPGEPERFPWEVSVSVPFTYNSNVANAETNKDQAFHADPTITIAKKWGIGSGVQFFIEGDVDSDAYTAHNENDSSTLMGQAGFRFGDATTGIAPYVHYTVMSLYTGQFDSHDVTIHHFTIGAKRSWAAGDHGRVALDANVLRREASVNTVELNRGTATLTYSADINETTSWSLSARGQYSHYTGGTSKGRDDVLLRVLGGVSFALSEAFSLDLQANFQRNWSDRAGKDYSVWDVGPTVTLSTKF